MLKQKPMVRFLAVAGSALLLVASCGQGSAESQDVSDDSQSHSPAEHDAETSVPSGKNDVESREDLENERVGSWTAHEIVDDSTIRVFFIGGDPKCFGSRAMVEESPSEIKIAVIHGSIPQAPENCTAVGASNAITVETEDKINERDIVPWDDPEL